MNRRLIALVMGNADYPVHAALKNPTNDADDFAERLYALEFSVIKAVNCTAKEMEESINSFKKRLKDNDVGLFFFAGHGMQIEGVACSPGAQQN